MASDTLVHERRPLASCAVTAALQRATGAMSVSRLHPRVLEQMPCAIVQHVDDDVAIEPWPPLTSAAPAPNRSTSSRAALAHLRFAADLARRATLKLRRDSA